MVSHFWSHVSCLVHGLHGVWCSFQGWDVGTLGNTLGNILSGCVTQDPKVGPSEACAIISTQLTMFICLCARVSPSVVHVGLYTNEG